MGSEDSLKNHETEARYQQIVHLLPQALQASTLGSDCQLSALLPWSENKTSGLEAG
jgi:hypothetical protein